MANVPCRGVTSSRALDASASTRVEAGARYTLFSRLNMIFHLVLVHGTGARGADWTQEERSTLRKHLKQVFGDQVSFSSPGWSGRNTYQDRVDGAGILRDEVKKTARDGRVPILVGHSHGGSLIAHALADDEELCEQVSGVIFLATPFVHARPLPLGRHLPKGPALLAGLLCALAVVLGGLWLIAAAGWPEERNRALSAIAFGLPFAGLFIWWATFRTVGRFLGVSEGRITKRTKERLAELVDQLDLSALETHGLNRKALIIRSTADEAASGLAAAQLAGRIASDVPSLTWKLPQWGWERLERRIGLDRAEPPGWAVWGFVLLMLTAALGFSIRGAAWLSEWPMLRLIDTQIRDVSSSVSQTLFAAFLWVANGVVLLLLFTVPLIVIGIPLKLASLLLYGLRGWPVLQAFYVELSVEPAPPGEWRVHQLDAKHYESEVERAREQHLRQDLAARVGHDSVDVERATRVAVTYVQESAAGAQEETTLAHSLVYDDPRAHRAIEKWLKHLSARLSGT